MTPRPVSVQTGQGIDWSEIHQRVEAAREALAQGAAPNSQESQSILRTSARAMSHEPVHVGSCTALIELVELSLAA
jgi:hypothetical protein